ncbi:RluA family pseudouridine synthase [Chamaesiphon sp. GL140_3_metabinner_50]|uniref:RluA family pseudouridine synthase n=1 Tax=Chamaesiphon sp. GL140_3_metabinner_50 TaxID=2970812 RepID=UPI0025D4A3C5|nr:RluA family pseudouridine synthase [Chamaesiphon sp. GL140_3_metabinner_50]
MLDSILDDRVDLFCQQPIDSTPTYWYAGYAHPSGELLKLPRTRAVEQIAQHLMAELTRDPCFNCEGKMYGVLLVKTDRDEYRFIKAFSGLLNGEAVVTGWVPPIPGRDRVAISEADTLADLARMKQELIELDRTSVRAEYGKLAAEFADKLERLSIEHRQRKEWRQQERIRCESTLTEPELIIAIDKLATQSRQDGRERRNLKQERDAVLQPLQEILDRNDERIRELKQQRKTRSRQLQAQMHDAYRLMNFLGTSSSLRSLMPAGMPTGTGDCCAPKLLHYAASQGLRPIAMAEFWWGDWETGGRGDGGTGGRGEEKIQREFYGACVDRCQPLMGFMLAGLCSQSNRLDLEIVYEDEYIIAIDKPAGLLSVPGRTIDLQDSVLTRLRNLHPKIYAVHRLDRDTSGLLLLTWDLETYRHLSRQFLDRSTHKVYEAILGGKIAPKCGSIELPLWGDPLDRPRQKVDFDLGKPSLTQFQVLAQIDDYARIEFTPVTGRTHQLRVHAADSRGLGVAILGDRLYGCQADVKRLHLHARSLSFIHPHTSVRVLLQTQCPF